MDNYGNLGFQRRRCHKLILDLPADSRMLVLGSLKAAEKWHKGQFRWSSNISMITHIYQVINILIGNLKVRDPEVLAAAALHDVVEDSEVSIKELRNKFGKNVASMVESESQDMFANRKRYMEHFEKAQNNVVLIKTADRIDNLRFVALKAKVQMGTVVKYVIEAEKYILPASKRVSPAGFLELKKQIRDFKRKKNFTETYRKLRATGDTTYSDVTKDNHTF